MRESTNPNVAGEFGSMAQAIKFVTEAGEGAAKVGRCGEYGTPRTHFVVWPNTAGVNLGNVSCPIHEDGQGKRGHIGQTVMGTHGNAVAVTKDYIKAIAADVNAAKRAKAAAAEATGANRKLRDLTTGDVFVYAPAGSGGGKGELPTYTVLRTVAVERLTGGKVAVTVVGTERAFIGRHGAYALPWGPTNDLVVPELVQTFTISGTAIVATSADGIGRYSRADIAEELTQAAAGAITWADTVAVDAMELARLTDIVESRREQVTASTDRLATIIANPPSYHTPAAQAEQVARQTSHVEERTANLAAIEARIAELTGDQGDDELVEGGELSTVRYGIVELDGPGEEDTFPVNVCGNCLALDGDPSEVTGQPVRVTFDEWAGRRLCSDCEPAPMVDGIRAGGAVRLADKVGANSGREAIVVRHELDTNAVVVQVIGDTIERTYLRSDMVAIATQAVR